MSRRVVEDWDVDPWDDPAKLYEFEAEPPPPRGRGIRWIAYAVLVAFVAAMLVAGGTGWWLVNQVNPKGEPGTAVNFTINQGDDLDRLADRLQAAGIITSARVFRWYAGRKGKIDFVPGYYTLKPKDNMGNIISVLRTPPAQTYTKVTFPEGFTVDQIAKRLESKVPRMQAATFDAIASSSTQVRSKYQPDNVTSLEGLLFPDTYQVAGNEKEEDVAKRMVKLMERIGARAGLDDAPTKVGLSPYQVLIVASMVEREAKVPEDRPMIARVIYNRLFFEMPLQVDATLYYGQPAGTTFAALKEIDSPYNTYKVKGLPPTPIANPGRASIEAALNPAANPKPEDCPGQKGKRKPQPCGWLYYVLADKDGRHAFATNLPDHEKNIAAAKAAGII